MASWGWDAKISPEKAAALTEYFSRPMLNPTSGSHLEINIPGALHPLQNRWLGLDSEIKIVEQKIEHGWISDRVSAQLEIDVLKRKQGSLVLLMHVKGLPVPDPYIWRNPKLPEGWRERWEQDKIDFPRKVQAEMSKDTKSQTGEGKKKGKPKKGKAIHPKPVKIIK